MEVTWYSNYDRFDQQAYGEAAVSPESRVETVLIDKNAPFWLDAKLTTTLLND